MDLQTKRRKKIETCELRNHAGVIVNKKETKIPAGKTILLNGQTEGEIPMKMRNLLIEAIQMENGGIQKKGFAIHSGVYQQNPDKKIRIRVSNTSEEEIINRSGEICAVFDSLVQEPADQPWPEYKKIDVETVREAPIPSLRFKTAEELVKEMILGDMSAEE